MTLEDERHFRVINMDRTEANYYLSLIKKIDDFKYDNIVEANFEANDKDILVNGSIASSPNNKVFSGVIYNEKNNIVIDLKVTVLLANKTYMVGKIFPKDRRR